MSGELIETDTCVECGKSLVIGSREWDQSINVTGDALFVAMDGVWSADDDAGPSADFLYTGRRRTWCDAACFVPWVNRHASAAPTP